MNYVELMHTSYKGEVRPTLETLQAIFDHRQREVESLLLEYQPDVQMADEEVAILGFQHGWYHDELSETDVFLVARNGREQSGLEIPYGKRYDFHFIRTAKLAGLYGCLAFQIAFEESEKERQGL